MLLFEVAQTSSAIVGAVAPTAVLAAVLTKVRVLIFRVMRKPRCWTRKTGS